MAASLRARPARRDLRPDQRDEPRRPGRHRDRTRRPRPLRGHRLFRREGAGHALWRARRRPPRLPGLCRPHCRRSAPHHGLARPRRRCARPAGRWWPAAATRRAHHSLPQRPAAGPCPKAGRPAARSRRARPQHLSDLLPWPAHGHLRRLRRRKVGAFVDAGPLRAGRRQHHRPGRRTRAERSRNSCRTISGRMASPARSSWSRPRTSRR